MPIYEFTCSECGTVFDELLPMSRADENGPCPACGAAEAERQISSFAAHSSSAASQAGCGAPDCGFQPGGG